MQLLTKSSAFRTVFLVPQFSVFCLQLHLCNLTESNGVAQVNLKAILDLQKPLLLMIHESDRRQIIFQIPVLT